MHPHDLQARQTTQQNTVSFLTLRATHLIFVGVGGTSPIGHFFSFFFSMSTLPYQVGGSSDLTSSPALLSNK